MQEEEEPRFWKWMIPENILQVEGGIFKPVALNCGGKPLMGILVANSQEN